VHALVPFDPELRADGSSPLHVHSFRYAWPDSLHVLGYSRTLSRDRGMRVGALLASPLYFAFAERALRALVRREGIDLVHAHWALPNGFVAARVKRATGVPFAVTLHGSDVFMAERGPILRAMARRTVAEAAHVTSCSAELRERLLRVAGEEHAGKVLVVANGTDVAEVASSDAAEARSRLGLEAGERLVLAVGRLVDKKGFRYFLEAAPAVLERHPDVRFVLGGGGELRAELETLARELGIGGRVVFTGNLSHDQVLALVAGAEAFVMPSVRDPAGNVDGLPIVVLEAMAAGKPVVATDISGIPLAVEDGRTGILVREKDAGAIARALLGLLGDPGRARALGAAGRERVRTELNWDAIAARHDALYRAAVAGRPVGSA
jgi:glycosyltransferase involved in cell wall biosynthesis